MRKEQENLRRLKSLVRETEGNVREAVRRYSKLSIAALARKTDIGRKDLDMTLGRSYGRKYPGVRRALELELKIPSYSLDEIIDHKEEFL